MTQHNLWDLLRDFRLELLYFKPADPCLHLLKYMHTGKQGRGCPSSSLHLT